MYALVYTLRHLPDGAERSLEGTNLTPLYRYGFDGRCEITADLSAVVASQQSILDAYQTAGFGGRLALLQDGLLPAAVNLPEREELEAMTVKELSKRFGIPKRKKSEMIDRLLNG